MDTTGEPLATTAHLAHPIFGAASLHEYYEIASTTAIYPHGPMQRKSPLPRYVTVYKHDKNIRLLRLRHGLLGNNAWQAEFVLLSAHIRTVAEQTPTLEDRWTSIAMLADAADAPEARRSRALDCLVLAYCDVTARAPGLPTDGACVHLGAIHWSLIPEEACAFIPGPARGNEPSTRAPRFNYLSVANPAYTAYITRCKAGWLPFLPEWIEYLDSEDGQLRQLRLKVGNMAIQPRPVAAVIAELQPHMFTQAQKALLNLALPSLAVLHLDTEEGHLYDLMYELRNLLAICYEPGPAYYYCSNAFYIGRYTPAREEAPGSGR